MGKNTLQWIVIAVIAAAIISRLVPGLPGAQIGVDVNGNPVRYP